MAHWDDLLSQRGLRLLTLVLAINGGGGQAIAADADLGLALAGQWCNSCHSIGNEEPRQEDAGPLFTELSKKDADYLQVAINRPHDFMPEFPSLSEENKADLIAYIQSLNES